LLEKSIINSQALFMAAINRNGFQSNKTWQIAADLCNFPEINAIKASRFHFDTHQLRINLDHFVAFLK